MDVTTWEYKQDRLSKLNLNELGKQGWEVCGVFDTDLILKRPAGILHVNEIPKEHSANSVER